MQGPRGGPPGAHGAHGNGSHHCPGM
jgi:hypothetical protein